MTKLSDLEKLAEAATLQPNGFANRILAHSKFQMEVTPATILALVKLCKQQHEVIKCTSACATHAPKLTQQMRLAVLAAFDEFDKGE